MTKNLQQQYYLQQSVEFPMMLGGIDLFSITADQTVTTAARICTVARIGHATIRI